MLKNILICTVALMVIAAFFFSGNVFASSGILSGSLILESASTYSIFEGNPVQYTVKWTNSNPDIEKLLQVKVINYFGNVEFEHVYTAAPGIQSMNVVIDSLRYGHFTIIASIGSESVSAYFSLVPNMEDRRDSSESPFALASMATRHTLTPIIQDSIDEYVRTISLAGVHYVREFLVARQVFLGENSYNYTVGKLDRLMQAYNDNNIDVTLMYQMMPNFLCRDGQRIPYDLLESYKFAKQLVEQFKGKVDAIEVENEPEHYADANSADYYAAFLKASAIGVQDADNNVKTINAAIIPTKNAAYRKTLFQNGIKDYIDAYNWHTYSVYNTNTNVIAYRPFIADVVSEAHKYGMFDKQLWTSETGLQIPFSDTTNWELTFTEQIAQARYAPSASVVALSMGEDKHFWFTHGYYYEQGNCYGTMTQNRMPYAIYSAISAYNNAMGNGVYKGKFKNIPSDVNGYAFVDGNESVGCFWSENPKTITLNIGQTSGVLIDIMGNETAISPNNGSLTINVGPDIVYLRIAGEFNPEIIEVKERIEKAEKPIDLTFAKRIVLQQEIPVNKIGNGYYKMDSNSENTVILNVYNLNEEAAEGEINTQSYYEWEVTPQSRTVSIPPMSKIQLEYKVTASGNTNSTMPVPLVFSGIFDGEKTSDSVSYIKDDNATIAPAKNWTGFDSAGSWRKNNNSESTINIYNVSSGTIRFNCSFTGGNIWSFPYVNLPSNQNFLKNSTGIIYEYRADKSVSGAVFGIYLVNSAGETFSAFKSVSLDTNWRQIIFNWDDFYKNNGESLDYNNIVSARIGMHFPDANANTFNFYIRNLGLGVSSEKETMADISMLGYTQDCIGVAFADSEVPVKDGQVVFEIDGRIVLSIVKNGEALINYPMISPPKEIAVMVYDESNRMIYKKLLNHLQQKENGVFVFGLSKTELNNALISAYDVSDLENATGNTDYINEDFTPHVGTGLTVNETAVFFELPQEYNGRFVVNVKTQAGKNIGLLLSRNNDIVFDYDYVIRNADNSYNSAAVYSLKRDKATIIFSAYKNGRLVSVAHKSVYLNTGEQLISAPSAFKVGGEDLLNCSVMIWDQLESLVPLSEALSLLYVPAGFSAITVIGTAEGNAVIELTGEAGNQYSGKELSLLITRKNVELSFPLSYADVIYIDQVTAGNKGRFTFTLPWDEEKGSLLDYNFDLYVAGKNIQPIIK